MTYVTPDPLIAADLKRGATLEEVAQWATRALEAGVDANAPLRVRVNLSGGIKNLEALTGPAAPKPKRKQ